MRERRHDAKTRVAIKEFLAGNKSAVETCWFLRSHLSFYPKLMTEQDRIFTEQDRIFITAVQSETDTLPVGSLRENWHPDFLPSKLEELSRYEMIIADDLRSICRRFLEVIELQKIERAAHEDRFD